LLDEQLGLLQILVHYTYSNTDCLWQWQVKNQVITTMFIPTQHASGEVIFGLKNLWFVREFVMLKISFKGSYFERLALSVMAVK